MRKRHGFGALRAGAVAVCVIVASTSVAAGETPARFGLCAALVEKVSDGGAQDPKKAQIFVQLNDEGRKRLLDFTTSRLGQTVEIVFDGVVLIRTRILSAIGSGKLLAPGWRSAQAASRFAQLLTVTDPAVPCGAEPTLEPSEPGPTRPR